MLMVIFGAGASYDSSPDFPPPLPPSLGGYAPGFPAPYIPPNPREFWRPPLASQLFLDPNGVFGDIVEKYYKLLPILPQLRRPSNDRSVEEELESWQAEASEDPERKRQLFSVRYYLHDLLLRVTKEWLKATSNVTNYVTLIDQIRHLSKAGEAVCLVTFNYDLILDQALLSFDYKPKDPEDFLFAHPNLRLFKPHGSVNWARYVDVPSNTRLGIEQLIEQADRIKLSDKYLQADPTDPRQMSSLKEPVVPAIAIPVQTKTEDTFEWPQSHRVALEQQLPSVTKILIIGWQAKEAHFLKLLREKLPAGGITQLTHLQVVGRGPAEATNISKQFTADISRNVKKFHSGPVQGGFSHFVAQGLVDFFFNY
jgi:hypothetical protein